MGIYTDILATARTFDTGQSDGERVGINRALTSELTALKNWQGDLSYPDGTSGEDATLSIHNTAAPAGSYKITVTLDGETSFTTAALVRTLNAAGIQTAINTAASAVPSWTNGDIVVTGGPLSSSPVVLTFSGESVVGFENPTASITPVVIVVTSTDTQGTTGVDEVQKIAHFANTVTGGTFTITFTVNGGAAVTTAAIARNANAAAIETAIDVAATLASVPSWANGSISVAGGPLTTGSDVTLTFDGDLVDETNQGQATVNGANLITTDFADAVVTDDDSDVANPALAILVATSIITLVDGVPAAGIGTRGGPNGPSTDLVKALIREAVSRNEDELNEADLLAAAGL